MTDEESVEEHKDGANNERRNEGIRRGRQRNQNVNVFIHNI